VSILERINRGIARLNGLLGSGQGTTAGTTGVSPALRHIEAAERQEFPPEESAAGEPEENE